MKIDLEKIFEEEQKIVVYDCDGTYKQEYINWLENKAKEAINYTHSSSQLPTKEEKNLETEKKYKEWTEIPIDVSLRDFSLGFSECYLWLKTKLK